MVGYLCVIGAFSKLIFMHVNIGFQISDPPAAVCKICGKIFESTLSMRIHARCNMCMQRRMWNHFYGKMPMNSLSLKWYRNKQEKGASICN